MLTHYSVVQGVFGLLTVFVLEGCGGSSQPSPVQLAIRTAEDTVALQCGPDAISFAVTAIARNDDSRPLVVALCGIEAQREIAGTWTTVFTPACLSSGLHYLATGDSVVVPVNVFGFLGPDKYPAFDPRMAPGRYRLVFGVGLRDRQAPTASSAGGVQASTPFTGR